MSTDLFNNAFSNPSNDYIHPDLAPCPDAGDSYIFEFLGKKNIGIVNSSKTLVDMSFSDLQQPVNGWTQDKKIIQPQEVLFVGGSAKGLTAKRLVYPLPDVSSAMGEFTMYIDMSVNYYKNFRYVLDDVSAMGDPNLNIGIADALNILFGSRSIGINASYDGSTLSFSGAVTGVDFDIPVLTILLDEATSILTIDPSLCIPAAKYPNTAMLGYMMKTEFPGSADIEANNWLYINHVPDNIAYYDTIDGINYTKHYKRVDVGLSGASTDVTMSAGDYLNYITENNTWEKLGSFRGWIAAPDAENSPVENLITGFYLYNPHDFPIMVDYLILA
jgi:hypothetical protein